MSNPDGHFTEDNNEYLHWMVGNIPSQTANSCNNADNTNVSNINLVNEGQTICPYLQPFPPYGTGYHRFVFILYKHKEKLDLTEYQQPEVKEGVNLPSRTFNTRKFFEKFTTNNGSQIIPVGLSFF